MDQVFDGCHIQNSDETNEHLWACRPAGAAHTGSGVVCLLLADPSINDVHDAVNRDGRFRDVRGNDAAATAGRRWQEDTGLHLERQRRVEWEHNQVADIGCGCVSDLHSYC
jgi:hypothetical protein